MRAAPGQLLVINSEILGKHSLGIDTSFAMLYYPPFGSVSPAYGPCTNMQFTAACANALPCSGQGEGGGDCASGGGSREAGRDSEYCAYKMKRTCAQFRDTVLHKLTSQPNTN